MIFYFVENFGHNSGDIFVYTLLFWLMIFKDGLQACTTLMKWRKDIFSLLLPLRVVLRGYFRLAMLYRRHYQSYQGLKFYLWIFWPPTQFVLNRRFPGKLCLSTLVFPWYRLFGSQVLLWIQMNFYLFVLFSKMSFLLKLINCSLCETFPQTSLSFLNCWNHKFLVY